MLLRMAQFFSVVILWLIVYKISSLCIANLCSVKQQPFLSTVLYCEEQRNYLFVPKAIVAQLTALHSEEQNEFSDLLCK